MASAVLFRSTRAGTIELAVSDRTAATSGVARADGWGREFRDIPPEWAEKLRRMREAERMREYRHRRREAPMSDVSPGVTLEPGDRDRDRDGVAIDARRDRLETGASRPLPKKGEPPLYPNAGRWFLTACRDRGARARGVAGNTAPGGAKQGGGDG